MASLLHPLPTKKQTAAAGARWTKMRFPFFVDVNFLINYFCTSYFLSSRLNLEKPLLPRYCYQQKNMGWLCRVRENVLPIFTFVYDFQLYTYTLSRPWLLSQFPVLIWLPSAYKQFIQHQLTQGVNLCISCFLLWCYDLTSKLIPCVVIMPSDILAHKLNMDIQQMPPHF